MVSDIIKNALCRKTINTQSWMLEAYNDQDDRDRTTWCGWEWKREADDIRNGREFQNIFKQTSFRRSRTSSDLCMHSPVGVLITLNTARWDDFDF